MARNRLTLSREVPASCARSACVIRIVTPCRASAAASSAISWVSTPATRLGTVWNDCRETRSFVSRSRRVSAAISLTAISGMIRQQAPEVRRGKGEELGVR